MARQTKQTRAKAASPAEEQPQERTQPRPYREVLAERAAEAGAEPAAAERDNEEPVSPATQPSEAGGE